MGESHYTHDAGVTIVVPADIRVSFVEQGISGKKGDPMLVSTTLTLAEVATLVGGP